MVRSCKGCAFASRCPVKTDLCSWPIPTKPWSRIHVDHVGPISGEYYVVVVYAYSKWPDVLPVRNPTTSQTVAEPRQLFARFISPEILVSDNGIQFTSSYFLEFCHCQGIARLRSPPFRPQSNGQAKRFVVHLRKPRGGTNIGSTAEIPDDVGRLPILKRMMEVLRLKLSSSARWELIDRRRVSNHSVTTLWSGISTDIMILNRGISTLDKSF